MKNGQYIRKLVSLFIAALSCPPSRRFLKNLTWGFARLRFCCGAPSRTAAPARCPNAFRPRRCAARPVCCRQSVAPRLLPSVLPHSVALCCPSFLKLKARPQPGSSSRCQFHGDGVPQNRSSELMTPAALHAAGLFTTRRRAGFFLRAGSCAVGGKGDGQGRR